MELKVKNDSLLTPTLVTPTNVPFPELKWVEDPPKPPDNTNPSTPASTTAVPEKRPGHIEEQPHSTQKVIIGVCSEFLEYSEPLQYFRTNATVNDANSSFRLIQDDQGQQIIFTVGNNDRLYCLLHVNGATAGWQALDITPVAAGTDPIIHFDVLQHPTNHKVFLAAATAGFIYHVTFTLKTVSYSFDADKTAGSVVGLDPSALTWVTAVNNKGQKSITSILCTISQATSGFKVFVGTKEQLKSGITATYYIIDPSPALADKPWTDGHLPEQAKQVKSVQNAALWTSQTAEGILTLYERDDGSQGCDSTGITPDNRKTVDTPLLLSTLGKVQSISSCLNLWGKTDFFAAGKGIGFFDGRHLDRDPIVILPSVSFRQVVAAEHKGPDFKQTNRTTFAVFGVSAEGDLYFVEGYRTHPTNEISFPVASGLPMRRNVAQVSPLFNKQSGSCEVMYTLDTGANEIHHLMRAPSSSLWSETTLAVKPALAKAQTADKKADQKADQKADGKDKPVQYPAYVTKISLTNGSDAGDHGVPEGYPVQLSSDMPVLVNINDRSHCLDSRPFPVSTDSQGQITITTRVHGLLGGPTFRLFLQKYSPEGETSRAYEIQPAQRVVHQLGKVDSADALRSAKSTNGKPVFGESGSGQKRDFDAAARVLKQFPDMLNNVAQGQPTDLAETNQAHTPPETFVVPHQDDDPSKPDESWLGNAVSKGGEILGDVIECIEKGFKVVLRVAIRVLSPGIRLYLKFQNIVLEFVVKNAVSLLRSVAHFLKETLHLDLTGLLGFLGFLFDIDEAKKTQKALKDVFTEVIACTKLGSASLGQKLETSLDAAQNSTANFFNVDPTPPRRSQLSIPGWLKMIIDNPITTALSKFNPISWIMDVVAEEAGSLGFNISVPSFSTLSGKLASLFVDWLEGFAETLLGLGDELGAMVGQLVSAPQNAMSLAKQSLGRVLVTLISAFKGLIHLCFEAFQAFLTEFDGLLNFSWKVPLVTELWEIFADQELSILNLLTFVTANILNLFSRVFFNTSPIAAIRMIQDALSKSRTTSTEASKHTVAFMMAPTVNLGFPETSNRETIQSVAPTVEDLPSDHPSPQKHARLLHAADSGRSLHSSLDRPAFIASILNLISDIFATAGTSLEIFMGRRDEAARNAATRVHPQQQGGDHTALPVSEPHAGGGTATTGTGTSAGGTVTTGPTELPTIHLPDSNPIPADIQRRGVAAQVFTLREQPRILGIPLQPDDLGLVICALQLVFQVAAGYYQGNFDAGSNLRTDQMMSLGCTTMSFGVSAVARTCKCLLEKSASEGPGERGKGWVGIEGTGLGRFLSRARLTAALLSRMSELIGAVGVLYFEHDHISPNDIAPILAAIAAIAGMIRLFIPRTAATAHLIALLVDLAGIAGGIAGVVLDSLDFSNQ